MQTFMPHCPPEDCARALDYRRLGKQRVEARQILTAIENPAYGWQHHPAVTMWRGYTDALKAYYNAICHEWEARGYKHNMGYYDVPDGYDLPAWWYRADVHAAHRGMLWRKDPVHYRAWQYEGGYTDDYVWPVER